MREFGIPALVLALLVALWELASFIYPDLSLVLPSPSEIGSCLVQAREQLWHHTIITLQEMGAGGLFAFIAAFPLAWIMALKPWARNTLQPLFLVIQCVPMFALAPIMVVWFDWSRLAIIIPTALMIFFPLTMTLYQGIRTTPKHLIEFFQMNNATSFQLFFKLQLPWAYPFIFSGLRITSAIAGMGAVAGEWAGGQEGLGILMLESRRGADLPMAFAALLCLTLISFSLYSLTSFLEKSSHKRRAVPFKSFALALLLGAMAVTAFWPTSKHTTRLVLDWLPNPNHIPLYVGVEKGFFSSRGISLEILKVVDPANNLPYLTSSQADLVVSYMTHVLRAKKKKIKVEPIGVLIQEPLNSIIFRKGIGIESPQDLTGKRIGYCIDGTCTRYLKALLEENRIVAKEVKNCSFDLVSTLGKEKVDAVYGVYYNIEGEFIRSFGIEMDYFTIQDLGAPGCYELLILAKEGGSPHFTASFQKALQESIDWSKEHPHAAFEIYAAAQPDKRGKTLAWEKRAWKKTVPLLASSQEIDNEKVEKFSGWLEERGLL